MLEELYSLLKLQNLRVYFFHSVVHPIVIIVIIFIFVLVKIPISRHIYYRIIILLIFIQFSIIDIFFFNLLILIFFDHFIYYLIRISHPVPLSQHQLALLQCLFYILNPHSLHL
jgi:hypothetical protein